MEKILEKYLKILKKCQLFEGVADEGLSRILSCLGARAEHFDKKSTIFLEGESAKKIGILLSGEAHVVSVDYLGNRNILEVITPSDMFCEAFACAQPTPMPVSVVAEKDCEVILVDAEHIMHTCEKACIFHRTMLYNLLKDLAKKTVDYHKRVEVTSKRTTRAKLMAYLGLMSEQKGSRSFDIPFDRQELADYLEVDRSGLSAEISKLKKEGLIDCHKFSFTIK